MSVPIDLRHLVMTCPNFVSPAFCHQMIERAETQGFQGATITTENGVTTQSDIRNNDRVVWDDPTLADDLWSRTTPYFAQPFKARTAIGLNERFRVYRYHPGQFFDWHQDGIYTASNGTSSIFTMMIYLNDEVTGGGTSFADVFSPHVFKDFTINPETGKLLLFHHPLSHRGDPIESGLKYVLRTDVMFALAR